jgi:hypothetical protein
MVHIPTAMLGHLRLHDIFLNTKELMDQFMESMREFDIPKEPITQVPYPRGPPIECLQVTPDGYCCNGCSYCVPQLGTFQKHWYTAHKDDNRSARTSFHLGTIQSFYNPTPQKWFEVLPDLGGIPANDPFTVYLQKEVPKLVQTLNVPPTQVREISPLLKITGWQEHLQNHINTRIGVREVRSLVKLPPLRQKEGLGNLGAAVDAYMKDIRQKANLSSIGIKCLLMECPR